MDVLGDYQNNGEKIPWDKYFQQVDEQNASAARWFLVEALTTEKWALWEAARNIVFATMELYFNNDGNVWTGDYCAGGLSGIDETGRATKIVLEALTKDIKRFDSTWMFMGYKNDSDPYGFIEDKSTLEFPPIAFYWWWRTGGLAKIDRYVYPIIFKEMTRTVEPLMMDLKRGASETEVLEKYPDLVTTFVLDALAGGKQYPYQYCFTYEDFPIVETEGEGEGEDEDEDSSANGVETIGARLLEALSKSVSQEKAERILERLPQWLDKRRKGKDCRPLLIATLSTLLEVEQEGLEDSPFESEKSQEKERVEAIATKNVQKAKGEVEPVNDDIKAVRRLLIRTFRVGRQKDRKKQGWNYENN